MIVEYIDNGKRALFEGMVFTRDDDTGYYLNSTNHLRLHRAVYERYNGAIPSGYHVHHIDHNRRNNEPENLIALTAEEHERLHGEALTEEQRERMRENLARTARPAASKWHKSEAGRQWHLMHYESMKDVLHKRESMTCIHCGATFEGRPCASRFCSNACKSAWRRKAGLDDETIQCEYCGREFTANKYAHARFCSRGCVNRWRALRRHSENQAAAT